jgi:hypothetical protein
MTWRPSTVRMRRSAWVSARPSGRRLVSMFPCRGCISTATSRPGDNLADPPTDESTVAAPRSDAAQETSPSRPRIGRPGGIQDRSGRHGPPGGDQVSHSTCAEPGRLHRLRVISGGDVERGGGDRQLAHRWPVTRPDLAAPENSRSPTRLSMSQRTGRKRVVRVTGPPSVEGITHGMPTGSRSPPRHGQRSSILHS